MNEQVMKKEAMGESDEQKEQGKWKKQGEKTI
jgi:hypothetical protein